jgi:serine/threonine protein kinase
MGGFGIVFKAIRIKDSQVLAIKRSRDPIDMLDEKIKQSILHEFRLMKEIPHPLIVKVIDEFVDNSGH